jgi:hypothetical protein
MRMLRFKRVALGALLAISAMWAQPALTPIQDTIYTANGMRFSGTLFITWNSFQAADGSNIASSVITLQIVNGALRVSLVPTTNASAGAQYNVTYNSMGRTQFTEVWAVPPSTVPLRVRDVRVSQGTVVGPPPVISPVQIGDVVGLSSELTVRPQKGIGFAIGRAAVINSAGQVDGATGNLGDCVRVDGSSGPCGGGGGGLVPLFSDGETPAGLINGSNLIFTLNFAPSPASSLDLYRNGLLMKAGSDYAISGQTITFFVASTPQAGDLLQASYRYADPNNPLGTLTAPQVVCSSSGTATSSTMLQQLGSCTIPAGLLGTGDRVAVAYQMAHTGSAVGFAGELHFGGSTILSRSTAGGETSVAAHADFGIFAGGQAWSAQSWGNTLSFVTGVGASAEDTSQAVTISFRGQMLATTTDSVTLRNFTVIRYPAQTNP